MSANDTKRYYWLKLQNDFFKRHDIKIVENMPNGKDYIIFYLKLLCESTSHEGRLRFSEEIPYSDEMLATITNTNVDVVKSAIDIFTHLRMIEVLDDGTLYMHQIEKMIGTETGFAKRKRIYRDNQKLLIGTNKGHCPQEIDIEIEKDIEKDKYICLGTYQNVKLTQEQLDRLKQEIPNYEEWIEKVDLYCQSTGKKYKDYLATIRNWVNKENKKSKPIAQLPNYNELKGGMQ